MLLIDSLYINNSGGLRLLEYLVKVLDNREVEFYLLADARCKGKFDGCKHVQYLVASLCNRKQFYKVKSKQFSSVLCFGNIPAPIKLDVPVFTYFHNINLLTLAETDSLQVKVKSWLKREVFKYYKNNTHYWLVQTSNTENELIKHLNEKPERVKLMPFYELPDDLESLKGVKHGSDYVFISTYVPGKGHEELLNAWKLLKNRGLNCTLHLTVPYNSSFADKIEKAQQQGVMIINHGIVPFKEVIEMYKLAKAIVFPSHNESLGLGIVEAITAGCDVLGADLPYTYSVCKPSVVFNPYDPSSIAEAVFFYEGSKTEKSKLVIQNMIDNLVSLLTSDDKRAKQGEKL